MTDEELNIKLYRKMSAEQDDLSPKQASALLQCEKPLDAVFRHYEDHGRGRMKNLWNAIEGKANAAMRECIKRTPQQER